MLVVPVYTNEHRPYSAILYPTSFTFDSLLALRICTQRKTYGLCFTPGPMAYGGFFVGLYVLGREGRRISRATGGPTGGHSNH